MTILLAEDNRALGDTLVRALTVEGHTVHWVHDGIQALDCLTQNTYDCWVTECVLPRMNADAVAACAAKQGVSVPSVGILGTSYYTDDTAALDVLLPKPFDMATLLLAIRRATEANGQEVYADVTLDLDAKELRYRGHVTPLTVPELDVARRLVQSSAPVSAEELYEVPLAGTLGNAYRLVATLNNRFRVAHVPMRVIPVQGRGYEVHYD